MGARIVRGLSQVWITAAGLATAALALAFTHGGSADGAVKLWWVELLRYVPYPAWLAPALIGLVASIWLRWPWRLLAAATLAGVLGPVMGLSLGRLTAPPAEADRTLRLMTYNIKSYRAEWQSGGYEAIAGQIEWYAPDVVAMQDAPHLNEKPLHSAMAAALKPYPHRFGFGQYVIASKHPLRDCRTDQVPAGGSALVFVRCRVLAGPRPQDAVTLLTVHTLTPRQGLNATRHEALDGVDDWQQNVAVRLDQTRQLARVLPNLPLPLIVAGDLNAPEQSPVVGALLATGLRDAFAVGGLGWGYTIGHALKPGISFVRIDHILVSEGIGVARTWVGGKAGSEHRPVIAELSLPR